MIYLITTLLLLMGIIYWVSGCRMMDHSNNAGKAKTETVKHEGGHH